MAKRMPASIALPGPEPSQRRDWETLKTLLPYLLEWKWRVIFALACLITAKVANVTVPLIFKDIIDGFTLPTGCGSKLWANSVARQDATCVSRLRQVPVTRQPFATSCRARKVAL